MPPIDYYSATGGDSGGPARHGFDIAKSDGAELPILPSGLYIGGAGDLRVQFRTGPAVTFTAVPAGTLLPIRPYKVLSTGTTATNIIGLA